VLGKVLGVCGAVWLCVRTGLGRLPEGVRPLHVLGVSAVAGIGFTVSLFIAELAYTDPSLVQTAKVGIFTGSIIAAALGALVMLLAGRRTTRPVPASTVPGNGAAAADTTTGRLQPPSA